jgi:hypothetical protein
MRIILKGMTEINMTKSKCKESPASGHVAVGGGCEYDHETSSFITFIAYSDLLTGRHSTF